MDATYAESAQPNYHEDGSQADRNRTAARETFSLTSGFRCEANQMAYDIVTGQIRFSMAYSAAIRSSASCAMGAGPPSSIFTKPRGSASSRRPGHAVAVALRIGNCLQSVYPSQ